MLRPANLVCECVRMYLTEKEKRDDGGEEEECQKMKARERGIEKKQWQQHNLFHINELKTCN